VLRAHKYKYVILDGELAAGKKWQEQESQNNSRPTSI